MYHPICGSCKKPINEVEFPDDYADTLEYYHRRCRELKLDWKIQDKAVEPDYYCRRDE